MRKIKRRVVYKIAAMLLLLIICLFLAYSHSNDVDRRTKILIIERSIRSPMNRGTCLLPQLPMDNPEILKFYEPVSKIDCGDSSDDWVTCEKSICFVKPEIVSKHGEVVCTYTDLVRTSDYKAKYGKSTKTKEPYVLRESDFVKAVCRAKSGNSWYGMAYGIRDGVSLAKHTPSIGFNTVDEEVTTSFNVLMLGFDSLSRNAFMRKLPKTYDYLIQELGSVVLKGYNIVGDGTPQALVPLLTGYTELELPETRRHVRGANEVDIYPMIWKDFAEHGYYTSFNEDVPQIGTFTYRMKGFSQQPVNHYLRTFYLEAPTIWGCCKPHCIGHQPDHIVMLEYTKNFMSKYKDSPRFIFSFHGGLSHDSINLIGAADEDVLVWLQTLNEKHLLDNTILIMMSDHGNRFSAIRTTLQGKQEERLPYFSFAFPKSFRNIFPTEYTNFVANANRLTTPFDVHATLKHLLALQSHRFLHTKPQSASTMEKPKHTSTFSGPENMSQLARERAISLFESIPNNRSCNDAYIEPHWCACLNWQELSLNESASHAPLLLKMGSNIVTTINDLTQPYRSLCASLKLERINWALRLQPHQELLKFKHNSDLEGFLADMSDNMQLHEEIYQLQIVVAPGNSIFEASVTYNLSTFKAHTKPSEISRVNKYGNQAHCIYERDPELRKYCYCRS